MTAKELFEEHFQNLQANYRAGIPDFPFGMSYENGRIWMQAQLAMLQWVLEMQD